MAAAVSNPHPSVGEVPPLESGSLIGDPECRAVDDLRLLEDLDGMLELVAGDRDEPWRIEPAAQFHEDVPQAGRGGQKVQPAVNAAPQVCVLQIHDDVAAFESVDQRVKCRGEMTAGFDDRFQRRVEGPHACVGGVFRVRSGGQGADEAHDDWHQTLNVRRHDARRTSQDTRHRRVGCTSSNGSQFRMNPVKCPLRG